MNKISFYTSLLLVILYGIYLRFYELGNGSFWIDEGFSSIVSYFSSLNNLLPYLPSDRYDFSQYLFTFFQSLSFNFLGINDFSARIPSFIFGILNIVVYFIFSNEIFKKYKYKNLAIFFMMFLFVFSTWQIIWSREARFYELLSFIYLLDLYFLWKIFTLNNQKYFIGFLITSFIGIFFHPFCFGLLIIGIILIIYKSLKNKDFKSYKKLILIGIIISFYFILNLITSYISAGNNEILKSVPNLNNLGYSNFISYFSFYIKSIYSQLGIIFISYFFMIVYFINKRKYTEFILFGVLIIVNIGFISYGNIAHTRYMFHLYSIITFIGSLGFIIFLNYFIKNYKFKYKKLAIIGIILLMFFSILKTYNITLIPQRIYYIDYTSPKPNFKLAYKYLKENVVDLHIVSGFPQICYWYNLENPEICSYGIRLNLIGNKDLDESLSKVENDYYTNIKYIDKLEDITDSKNTYFVLDDLSIKNAVNKDLIDNIINKCFMIYKDVGNYEANNFIGIWKCNN